MIKELVHDPILLGIPSEPAAKEDQQTARDLLDTLVAHRESCVGMAANMIGVHKRIIVFDNEGSYMTMFNPETSGPASRPSRAGLPRSSSTRSTIATGF